jgi:hypothetical protein
MPKEFKQFCSGKEGWQIGEEGEWVKDDQGYHMIICSRSMSPHTLRSMIRRGRMSIREREFWKVEDARLMIFVSENLPGEIVNEIEESEELQHRVVLYDVARGLKVGCGDEVSAELEKFLGKKSGKSLKSHKRSL